MIHKGLIFLFGGTIWELGIVHPNIDSFDSQADNNLYNGISVDSYSGTVKTCDET